MRGFEQRAGEDYDETFTTIIRIEVVRWLLAYYYITRKKFSQIDFLTIFLNVIIDGECIYVEQPHGWEKEKGLTYYLLKIFYGLKQAPYLWQQTFEKFIR